MVEDEILWIVPLETRKNQCIHIVLRSKNEEFNVIGSEYQCLYGHRRSELMSELVLAGDGKTNGPTVIHIEEKLTCDVLPALLFMHSDSLEIDFTQCSALTYAQTAHFLKVSLLSESIVEEASKTLLKAIDDPRYGLQVANPPMSVWDAVSILHLLGDTHQILPLMKIEMWCER
jgi:hypothetical protein